MKSEKIGQIRAKARQIASKAQKKQAKATQAPPAERSPKPANAPMRTGSHRKNTQKVVKKSESPQKCFMWNVFRENRHSRGQNVRLAPTSPPKKAQMQPKTPFKRGNAPTKSSKAHQPPIDSRWEAKKHTHTTKT